MRIKDIKWAADPRYPGDAAGKRTGIVEVAYTDNTVNKMYASDNPAVVQTAIVDLINKKLETEDKKLQKAALEEPLAFQPATDYRRDMRVPNPFIGETHASVNKLMDMDGVDDRRDDSGKDEVDHA